ncbi:GNAT family N-acetyltransferase [Mesorhizobium atlanticum]
MAGRGFGPELGRAILRHAFEELGLDQVVALIRPDNARAIRAAQKIGFGHVEDRHYENQVKGFYEGRASQYGLTHTSSGPGRNAG